VASSAERNPAGSRSILVVCPYPVGVAAGQRLKYEQYIADWRSAGYAVDIVPFMSPALWSIAHQPGRLAGKAGRTMAGLARRLGHINAAARYDLVYLFMWAAPVGGSGAERLLLRRAKRLIYDIEDHILDQPGQDHVSVNPLLRWLRGASKARYLVAHADHVIASSPELARRCAEINYRGAATYITSSVDTERFVPANDYRNDDPVVIGWTGTISSRPYLDMLRPVFAELAKQRRFRLRVIGNFDYDLPGIDLEVLRWSAAREVEQMQGIDIGVYPLPNDEWVGGKSGLKAIQYMAFGLPCVATRAGHTPEVIANEVTGLLVSDQSEWVAALVRLIDDADLRRTLGTAARSDAVRRFSLTATASAYRSVIEDVMRLPAHNEGTQQR
jgi:glycosyltransferase involved in cell wall biosynthesis